MLDPKRLKVVKKEVIGYPNKKCLVVDMISSDNSIYEATKGKAEVDLALYLKCNLNLNSKSLDKLVSLINEYGDERYDEAINDCAMDDAGADL